MSASKANVLERLGLSGSYGESVYRLMLVRIHATVHERLSLPTIKDEAGRGRDRVSSDFNNLTSHSQSSPMIQPPYKWDQLTETARHREILNIAARASDYTKPYFQKGSYRTSVAEENWVAQWFMWHCFRYRDNRPRGAGSNLGLQGSQGGRY